MHVPFSPDREFNWRSLYISAVLNFEETVGNVEQIQGM
jgi:hypothetical protein